KLYVGDLLESVTKDDLEKEFRQYGRIKEVWVARNPPGFAFIEFAHEKDIRSAVRSMNGKFVMGSRIRVEYAKTPLSRDQRNARAATTT
ncbi:hypothetical protein CAPTEDRAFT_123867, partial [Capitella teleta]